MSAISLWHASILMVFRGLVAADLTSSVYQYRVGHIYHHDWSGNRATRSSRASYSRCKLCTCLSSGHEHYFRLRRARGIFHIHLRAQRSQGLSEGLGGLVDLRH